MPHQPPRVLGEHVSDQPQFEITNWERYNLFTEYKKDSFIWRFELNQTTGNLEVRKYNTISMTFETILIFGS